MKGKIVGFFLIFSFFFIPKLSAQRLAIKTNVIYDITKTINLGAEYRLNSQWTLDFSGNYKNWSESHLRRWKHWLLQPEFRYWTCESFGGHFFGIHLQGGMYNVGNLKNGIKFLGTDFSKISHERYEGWLVGAGVSYGYAWILNKRWNLEAEIGLGYNFTQNDRYPCALCGEKIESNKVHHYVGPTKLAFNIVYIL